VVHGDVIGHILNDVTDLSAIELEGNSMNTEEQTGAILAAMELVAEKAGDVAPAIFGRYFERCRESRELMEHMDEHMLGRMMDQVLLLIMDPGEEELASYIVFETASHRAYGVQSHMYESLMYSVRDVIADVLGDALTSDMSRALKTRIDYLLGEITAAA
jgi:hypothetical protein